ncbi:MAG TPA: DUF4862 family protein [bacterium]|nr:DUF4862 family protein [bacterium]
MRYMVGAYAAAPPLTGGQGSLEQEFYARLRDERFVAGLELPFWQALHPQDEKRYVAGLSPAWDFALTLLPGTMEALAAGRTYGLASVDEDGRQAALRTVRRALDAVKQLNDHCGRAAVGTVELHSAPRQGPGGGTGSVAALTQSLRELRAWDWQGAVLALEHCDAFVPGQAPAKGFLALPQELQAIRDSDPAPTPLGMTLNWGRSALEGRNATLPLEHVRSMRAAGRLRGIIFSGCTASHPLWGAWQDTHAPFGPAFGLPFTVPESLLTAQAARECLAAAPVDELALLGFKIKPLPDSLPVSERVDWLRGTAAVLDRCVEAAASRAGA